MKHDEVKRIEDLINTARRAAQNYDDTAYYDDAAQAAYKAFNALADAIAGLLRLIVRAEDADPLAADRSDPLWQKAEEELTAIAHALLDERDNEWKLKVYLYWGTGYENVAEYRSVQQAYQAALERRLARYVISVDRLPDGQRLAWLLKRVRDAKAEASNALRRYGSMYHFYDTGQIDRDEMDEAAEACATADQFVEWAYRDYAETCRHMGVDPVSLEAIKEGGEA